MKCDVVQCSAVQCSAVQCSAVQCSAVQFQCVRENTKWRPQRVWSLLISMIHCGHTAPKQLDVAHRISAVWYANSDVQFLVCRVLWILCSVLCIVCSVLCVVCSVLCIVCSVLYIVCSILCALTQVPNWMWQRWISCCLALSLGHAPL